jgi:flagellar biosynthesis chaperone FliJ
MTSIRNSIQINRRIMILIGIMLTIILVLLAKFYFNQRSENRALRLKIISMSANKRTPKSWSQLTTRTQTTTSTTPAIAATPAPTPSTAPAAQTPQAPAPATKNEPLANVDTVDLAVKLDGQMKRPRNLDLNTIENNIAIADEIISREPDSYSAYKAKLISLLVKEGKFQQPIDEVEVEGLLENMAQFNISSDKLARRESALIGNTNSEVQTVELQLEELARSRETIESQLGSYDANSPELAQLNAQIQELDTREAQLLGNIDNLQESLANNTAQLTNEDVVEIPFMRMMAKSDYDSVIDNAQTFIEQFPNSPNGYFYLVRALEMQGQKDQARSVIQNARLPQDVQATLLQRLENEGSQNPQSYWQKLSF